MRAAPPATPRSAAVPSAGLVRVRAARSRWLAVDETHRLRAARNRGALAATLRELGLGDGDAAGARQVMLQRLLHDHEVLAAAYPKGRDLFVALAGLQEVENLKLAWRAVRGGLAADRWLAFWRPLGRLATLRLADWREVRTPAELAERAAKGPWAEVAAAAAMQARDAELVFDCFASRRIVQAARALPRREAAAASLALGLVRERDLDALRRAPAWDLTPDLAAAACALLPDEMGTAAVEELASRPHELDDRLAAARRDRLAACRRAFLGPPFRLAPAVALLMLETARVDEVTALVEAPPC